MSEISQAIKQICDEKGLSYDAVIQTIESALAAAYRKDFGEKNQNIHVEYNPETNESKVYDIKTVVEDMPEEEIIEDTTESDKATKHSKEEKISVAKTVGSKKNKKDVKSPKAEKKEETKDDKDKKENRKEAEEEVRRFNPKTEIQISDAKELKKTAGVGDEIKTKLPIPDAYGRMAAQTAKQVIIQKLREAERDMVFNEFKDKEHEVIAGVVQRREGRVILIDLGKAVGILPNDEQIYGEKYKTGQRIKIYVKEVNITPRGPEIILSRTSEEILKKVFYLEIPEISNGLVEIKSVAREAGSRSKVAVHATSDNVDPIGSCVGQRGARIQTIINELGGEKIDIIEYDEDITKFIANALAPAKVLSVEINKKEQKAMVKVADDQLSLAIGKDGQNVRLAARLTGWKIDISGEKNEKVITADSADDKKDQDKQETVDRADKTKEKLDKKKKTNEENKTADDADKKRLKNLKK